MTPPVNVNIAAAAISQQARLAWTPSIACKGSVLLGAGFGTVLSRYDYTRTIDKQKRLSHEADGSVIYRA